MATLLATKPAEKHHQPPTKKAKRPHMPAPKNNQNAVKHGLRARRDLTTVSLGKGFESSLNAANKLRARQEARIRAQGGQVTEEQDRRIQRAALEELASRAAGKRHRDLAKHKDAHPGMTTAELLELDTRMAEAVRLMTSHAAKCDKILTRLHLDTAPADPFATLRAQQAQANGVTR